MTIEVRQADITTLAVDAIVNAAKQSLLGAAASTAPSTEPPVPACWPSAGPSALARPAELDRPDRPPEGADAANVLRAVLDD